MAHPEGQTRGTREPDQRTDESLGQQFTAHLGGMFAGALLASLLETLLRDDESQTKPRRPDPDQPV